MFSMKWCNSLTAMSNVTIILCAVIAAAMSDYQHVLPTLCGRISKATAGTVNRNVCLDSCASSVLPTLSCIRWARDMLLFLGRCLGFWQQQQAGPVYSSIFVVFWCGLQGRKFPCLAVLLLLRAAVPTSFIYDILEESQRKAKVEICVLASEGWWSKFGSYECVIAQSL